MKENKQRTPLTQKDYQKKYDKKTKSFSLKYTPADMNDYNRMMEYLAKIGQSRSSFVKGLINDFFEKKHVMNDSKIAEYFIDYGVSEELLDKLKETVGRVKYDIIMDYCKKDIESDISNAFSERGSSFEDWIEEFLMDIESGDLNINLDEKDFRELIDKNMSDSLGYIHYNG